VEGTTILQEALALARAGDVDGAIALLREARSTRALSDGERTLFFQFLGARALLDEALEVATEAVEVGGTTLMRSNWTLRRGLLFLELAQRDDALKDLLLVQKLKANEGHLEQARAALLKVAQLPRKK
jgi:hypothetical protein